MIIKPILECQGVKIEMSMDEVEREAGDPSVLQAELQTIRDRWADAGWENLQAKVVKGKNTEPCPYCDRKFSTRRGVSMHITQMRRHGHEDHGSDEDHGGW